MEIWQNFYKNQIFEEIFFKNCKFEIFSTQIANFTTLFTGNWNCQSFLMASDLDKFSTSKENSTKNGNLTNFL